MVLAEAKLIYAEGDLLIVTPTGAALQDGFSIGDVVRVRNSDSGVTVSGAVQPDGSVRVGGGWTRSSSIMLMLVVLSPPRRGGAKSRTFPSCVADGQPQLVGYGLVVGRGARANTFRNAAFTQECCKILALTCMASSCAS